MWQCVIKYNSGGVKTLTQVNCVREVQPVNYHILDKNKLDGFIVDLSRKMKVYAPVSRGHGNFAFEEVTSGAGVALKYIPTILPPKKYLMPQREKMLEFDVTGDVPKDTAVLEAGERESGATVPFVNEEYDKGAVLLQRTVPVLPDDTPGTLAARVLECEHALYPDALEKLLAKERS